MTGLAGFANAAVIAINVARQAPRIKVEMYGFENGAAGSMPMPPADSLVTWRPSRRIAAIAQKILAALTSVFQMPQPSGMPTKHQNSAAWTSKPPLPMPNDPVAAWPLALAA